MLSLKPQKSPAAEFREKCGKCDQLNQLETKGCFEVIGCDTGKRYRISQGAGMNVYELNKSGEIGWCFVPNGYLPVGDVMLAQKIALESNELATLAVANVFSDC